MEKGNDEEKLPLKEVPGVTKRFCVEAFVDRLRFFWFDGPTKYLNDRILKYGSTVFRTNMPPGPPFFPGDTRVIMLLDSKSLPIMFNNSLVDKKDVSAGHYINSMAYTGGYRILTYLDTMDEKHTRIKSFLLRLYKMSAPRWFPEILRAVGETLDKLNHEKHLEDENMAEVFASCAFNFTCRALINKDPTEPGPASLGEEGGILCLKWAVPQIATTINLGLPHLMEEILFHTCPWPFFLVKRQHERLYAFFETYATQAVEIAEKDYNISKEEALHNLIFMVGQNMVTALARFVPTLIKHVASQGMSLHARLAKEVRDLIESHGGGLSMEVIQKMHLVKSTVLESLRFEPSLVAVYGRARQDMIVESHDARFSVKAGEFMCGYLLFAMKDPKLFDRSEEFVADRFVGESGKKLFERLWWSNGLETKSPTPHDKQCLGKDLVEFVGCMLLAVLFSKYDTLTVKSPTDIQVVLTSLTPRA